MNLATLALANWMVQTIKTMSDMACACDKPGKVTLMKPEVWKDEKEASLAANPLTMRRMHLNKRLQKQAS